MIQFGQGYIESKVVTPRGVALKMVMRCACGHLGCEKDFGDPEGHNHGRSNFISWALWVIGHHEVAHGTKVNLQPADVAKLLRVKYLEVPA